MVAGSLEEPRVGAYVVAVSTLREEWYTSLLELYDPAAYEPPGDSGAGWGEPRQFAGVPPVPEGIKVRFQGTYRGPLEAGADYGFLRAALLEEALEPDERLTGLEKVEGWITKREQEAVFERLYSNPELAGDPEYRAELERQIRAIVPDPEEREALHSFYAFRYDIPQ